MFWAIGQGCSIVRIYKWYYYYITSFSLVLWQKVFLWHFVLIDKFILSTKTLVENRGNKIHTQTQGGGGGVSTVPDRHQHNHTDGLHFQSSHTHTHTIIHTFRHTHLKRRQVPTAFKLMKAGLECGSLYLLQQRFEWGGNTSASQLTLTKFSSFYWIFIFFIFLLNNLCIEKIHPVSKEHWKHCALQYIIMRKRRNI